LHGNTLCKKRKHCENEAHSAFAVYNCKYTPLFLPCQYLFEKILKILCMFLQVQKHSISKPKIISAFYPNNITQKCSARKINCKNHHFFIDKIKFIGYNTK